MNPQQLFLQDRRFANVWFCEQCKVVHRTASLATACCSPKLCEDCNRPVDRQYYTTCTDCGHKRDAKREARRFDAAEKIKSCDWSGWVYWEGDYFESVEDFLDQHDGEPPDYVWACSSIPIVDMPAFDSMLQHIEESAYEDFHIDILDGLDDLRAAFEKFQAINSKHVSYSPDYKKAVLLTKKI